MITKRIIPCLDVKNGRVVKGVNFEGLQDMADPVEMARYYNASGADELVFYDITASVEGRGLFTDISRDGTMQGTNMALYRELLTIPGIEVTASGGIAAMAELAELSAMHCHAALWGKSIYTGAIDLAEAVRLYESK